MILKDSASLYALYLTDGTKLLGHGYTDIIYREDLGVFTLKNLEGTKQVYIPGCGKRDLNDMSVSGQFIKDYSYNYMIIATGEAVQLGRSSEMQQASMVDCSQGLMDMYSGTVLLDAGYTFVTVTEEHVYELRDNVWHVYTYDLVAE